MQKIPKSPYIFQQKKEVFWVQHVQKYKKPLTNIVSLEQLGQIALAIETAFCFANLDVFS